MGDKRWYLRCKSEGIFKGHDFLSCTISEHDGGLGSLDTTTKSYEDYESDNEGEEEVSEKKIFSQHKKLQIVKI